MMSMSRLRTLSGCYFPRLLYLFILIVPLQSLQAQESPDDGLYEDMPVVLSATRLRQSVRDAPITMDDIDQIEVVRGPNAASYGSNSFMGVINIITRDSALDRGTSVKTNIGDNGLREGFLRHGSNLGDMDYVFSVGYREDHGFKKRHDSKAVKCV